jgi:hypothetical protein
MLRHGVDRREARKAEHGCIFGIHADDRPAELRRRQIDDDAASDAFGRLLPIRDVVRGASEILGLDPLHVANEGQFLAIVAHDAQAAALAAIHAIPGGEEVVAIGEIVAGPPDLVQCRTPYGSSRIVDMLVGDPLPRIC